MYDPRDFFSFIRLEDVVNNNSDNSERDNYDDYAQQSDDEYSTPTEQYVPTNIMNALTYYFSYIDFDQIELKHSNDKAITDAIYQIVKARESDDVDHQMPYIQQQEIIQNCSYEYYRYNYNFLHAGDDISSVISSNQLSKYIYLPIFDTDIEKGVNTVQFGDKSCTYSKITSLFDSYKDHDILIRNYIKEFSDNNYHTIRENQISNTMKKEIIINWTTPRYFETQCNAFDFRLISSIKNINQNSVAFFLLQNLCKTRTDPYILLEVYRYFNVTYHSVDFDNMYLQIYDYLYELSTDMLRPDIIVPDNIIDIFCKTITDLLETEGIIKISDNEEITLAREYTDLSGKSHDYNTLIAEMTNRKPRLYIDIWKILMKLDINVQATAMIKFLEETSAYIKSLIDISNGQIDNKIKQIQAQQIDPEQKNIQIESLLDQKDQLPDIRELDLVSNFISEIEQFTEFRYNKYIPLTVVINKSELNCTCYDEDICKIYVPAAMHGIMHKYIELCIKMYHHNNQIYIHDNYIRQSENINH